MLLADEPTGSLDFATGETVMELMFELNREAGTTLVLVTHDRGIAARCDRQLRIEAGRVETRHADVRLSFRDRRDVMPRLAPEKLRSHRWFGAEDLRTFGHRSRMAQMGYAQEDYAGKPVIAILNTWSDINPCHAHFTAARRGGEARRLAGRRLSGRDAGDVARRAVPEADARCSTATCSRWRPRSCCARYPVDGAVLMGGCDKTTPGAHHGRDVDGPAAIYMPAGPMLRGNWSGQHARLGLRHVEILGRAARRHASPMRLAGDRGRHRALARPLHDDGHGLDDDERGRGAGADAAGRRLDPGRRFAPCADGDARAARGSSRWSGKTCGRTTC